jgi:hypothetical protein
MMLEDKLLKNLHKGEGEGEGEGEVVHVLN